MTSDQPTSTEASFPAPDSLGATPAIAASSWVVSKFGGTRGRSQLSHMIVATKLNIARYVVAKRS